MSKKTAAQQDAERRAEARRRARMTAQGRVVEDAEDESTAAPAAGRPSMSLMQRLFPAAPPLPGKPAPLAGFTYTGGMRPLVLAAWLIRQNLYAGIGMGILWAASYVLTIQEGRSLLGTIASFISFGALVAAGWIGWQRPWFYGLVAAVIGYIAYAVYFLFLYASEPAISGLASPSQVATYLFTNGALQAAIGGLAGFYGGYLRRRIADPANRQAAAARRRR
ncbi:MAG: hypothetical protein ACXWWU_08005 [Candidatus Limnocylindria bacterium]